MPNDLLGRCVDAKRESRRIDFKESFDPTRTGDWCEITKDIVAMANSGGGAIVFGVRNNGDPSGFDPSTVLSLDPAKITDKVATYTGEQFSDFEIVETLRDGNKVAVLIVHEADMPMVFSTAGNYDAGGGRQKVAFQNGTVYFRHGAKSEPGNSGDLRAVLEREVERRRRSWLRGIRKVVTAPRGHSIEVLPPGMSISSSPEARPVRLVDDPRAEAVRRLDPDLTHPFRQKELVVEVQRRLGGRHPFTGYHNQKIRRTYGFDENSRPEYVYCSKYGSPQYSEAYVEWIIRQFEKDPGFFTKATEGTRSE